MTNRSFDSKKIFAIVRRNKMLSNISSRMRLENEKPLFTKWSQIYLLLEKPAPPVKANMKSEIIDVNDKSLPRKHRHRRHHRHHSSRSRQRSASPSAKVMVDPRLV